MKPDIKYKALVVEEVNGTYFTKICKKSTLDLPTGDVLIKVHYSSVNYKDALSATGNKGVTKKYPHVPGIDAAGEVVYTTDSTFVIGEKVIVTGNDLGMNTPGGWGQYISVPSDWIVKLPSGLSLKEAMIIGTAGFTAGISLMRLTALVKAGDGRIVVSGATGGVGSVAVSILSKLNYEVTAISRKTDERDFLELLGAKEIISPDEFLSFENKPILSAVYAGGIDAVGGKILENMLKMTKMFGAVTTCGSVSGNEINISVFPFILRGVSLIGISSQNYPSHLRAPLWEKLAGEWKPEDLLNIYSEIDVSEIGQTVNNILKGKLKGRTIVRML